MDLSYKAIYYLILDSQGFLDWAVLRGKIIAAYAPSAQILETKNPFDIGYANDDQEII